MAEYLNGMQPPEDYIGHHEPENAQISEQTISFVDPETGEPDWMQISRDAYETSTDYFDSNIRKQVEKNLSLFRNKHPDGSKYYQESYRYRSKIFRPKTRAMTRRHEAAAALAFFSTVDVVSCQPEDPKDQASVYGARFGKNWLEYRLEHSIPWFKTVIGAYQDAMNQGIVISRQEWLYEEKVTKIKVPEFDANDLAVLDEAGSVSMIDEDETDVRVDKPNITLVPLENFRFSSAADWRDPVNDSPFLIEMMPMFVCHVMDRMRAGNERTGEAKWYKLTDAQLIAGSNTQEAYDSTRRTRDGKREDPKEESYNLQMFDIVWVHRNIIEIEGEDWVYYTLGTQQLLSKPVPVTDVFLHGRPYTMGSAIIETHRNYPSGVPELAQDLQLEANDLANQTLDNSKLANNKRYRARRSANVDWKALKTSIPGGIVLMDDLNDVKEEAFTDITQSAFENQNRNNADFDEIVGNFSNGSVQTNRSLNETVGGMAMQLDDSNVITEYQLRCFTESWVEDTLRMVLTMGKHYETSERILQMIGEGTDPNAVAALMDTDYGLRVAVGFGATSPHKRIEKISIGLKTIAEFLPNLMQKVKGEEVLQEVFGALGFRDGSRFFDNSGEEDPRVADLQSQLQQAQQLLEGKQLEVQSKVDVANIREQGQLQREQMKIELQREAKSMDTQIDYIGAQIAAELNDIKRGELILQQEALLWQKEEMVRGLKETEIQKLTDEDDRLSSVLMNDRYGAVPHAEDRDDGKKKPE